MRGTGKKATHQESIGPSCSKENESMLIASLKVRKGSKSPHRKRQKLKSKSHLDATGSNLAKCTASDPPSKGVKNGSARKLIRKKIQRKSFSKKSSAKLTFPEAESRHPSVTNSDGNGKISNEDARIKKLKKRKNKSKVELDEPLRLQRRAKYLLIKLKLEQNLIDAYSGEGWKGQSREKIRPEKELLRAKKQILKCKLGIRDTIRQLDSLSTVGCIEDSVMAPDGSVSHEHIFCAKCKLNEVSADNDIVLCDGICNCAFHQKCHDPPLDTENIPPGDQGWFCKSCERRMQIIETMNAHLGTDFAMDESWQDIFKDEAALPDGENTLLNPETEWPSDDSEDDDYDPERRENSMSGAGTDNDASDDASSSTSLGWSSDGEVFLGSRSRETKVMDFRSNSIYSSLDSDETSDEDIICGPRRRRQVDYKKLYDEMFGKDATAHEQASEDEDWGPRKRKRKEKESDAASTLMTLYESEKQHKNIDEMEGMNKLPRDQHIRRPFNRMPPHAVEKLRQVFTENELPSRTVKENLSKELGLELGKVSKWFKNARYLALKSRKGENAKQFHSSVPETLEEPKSDVMKQKHVDLTELNNDTSREIGVCTSKNLKKVVQKKLPKSLSGSLRKDEGVSKEITTEHGDDVSLKLLKEKSKRVRKKFKSSSPGASQAADAEMERLCRAKDRLDRMKQTLLRFQTGKAKKSSKTHLLEESVIYFPIAELKEKF
ncbi:hypothetical protein Tsubulata_016055 [Turnera subulata]|uniref:Pathogenesis-related homeodomain protein n=1 Tax=Turnera subulata TaxID=218843 RepID=A0A9Q0FLY7_9ROSI|nr:hypothetical protein Tsubulata_016055 [Turnera subulata]